MEKMTINSLFFCCAAYCDLSGKAEATVGNLTTRDWQYFEKLRGENPNTTTLRKVDTVMAWFDANWPEGVERPVCLDDWKAAQQWAAHNSYSNTAPEFWPRIVVPTSLPPAAVPKGSFGDDEFSRTLGGQGHG